ncbi:hypothetical protein RR42_s1662 [Cupriavidus basilensis]|uniref:Uncharacterized protein n=1 Tax=Cupriavidus basilensis TaxID=68895 RepID=A0A0C4YL16_9BURK|nr:hypothetical protein RR42_s1662 [Cupriavidus basilensis]
MRSGPAKGLGGCWRGALAEEFRGQGGLVQSGLAQRAAASHAQSA